MNGKSAISTRKSAVKLNTHIRTLMLIFLASTGFVSFIQLATVQAGEPAGDSTMLLSCVGIIPSTPNCADETLGLFETLIYDRDENGLYTAGDFVIIGPVPTIGVALVDDLKIQYRDTNDDTQWSSGEPVFYDLDGNPATTDDRVFLIGTPTTLTTLIKDDPLIKFADAARGLGQNGRLDGVVRVTARLERVGGTNTDSTQEDVDAIQVVYNYDNRILQIMRVSYPTGSVLPDQSRYATAVRDHCTASGGSPLESFTPDEAQGLIQTTHACLEGPPRTNDSGLGCDPNTSVGVCPGDPATGGTTPLQNFDVVRVQFMVLARGTFTFTQRQDAPGTPGTKTLDVDDITSQTVPLELATALIDNRRAGNQPPVADFTFTPTNPTAGETVTFDGRSSTDPDGSIISYTWNFGDNTSPGSGAQPFHRYNSAATFTITLTVTDDEGTISSTQKTITVNPISLRITVQDPDGNPVQGALVEITKAPQGQEIPASQTTSADGTAVFLFPHFLAGNYTYRVTATGFEPKTQNATILTQTNQGTINLARAPAQPSPFPTELLLMIIGVIAIIIVLGIFVYLRKKGKKGPKTQ